MKGSIAIVLDSAAGIDDMSQIRETTNFGDDEVVVVMVLYDEVVVEVDIDAGVESDEEEECSYLPKRTSIDRSSSLVKLGSL